MGIYSEIINSCNSLGPEYVGYLQTKDLEGVFDQYWISPNGCLFRIYWPPLRHDETTGFEPGIKGDCPHGRVSPFRFTGLIRIAARHAMYYTKRPVWFLDGQLVSLDRRGDGCLDSDPPMG